MVASESAPLSELDKQVTRKLAYWFKHPSPGIVPIFREGGLTMSASAETVAGATVGKVDSTPEIRIQAPSTGSGDGRRGESISPGSTSLPGNFRQSSNERPAYLIKWSRFEDQLSSAFAELFCSEHFADVTLACDGGVVLKAHKIILAMSSPFFRRIFIDTPCKHPIIVLKEFTATVMRNILQYLYMGKVVLNDNEISSFMDAADFFGICGVIPDHYSCDIFATTITESDQTRYSEREPQSETDTKLSEGSRTSENEELGEIRDSQLQDDDGAPESRQSPVIKYHGIKARWTRRYSNTSFPGAQSSNSTTVKEHKRSASAGEVETVPRTVEQAQSPEISNKIPRLADDLRQPLRDFGRSSSGDGERLGEQSSARDDESEGGHRKVIQRTYPKDYSSHAFSNPEDSSDVSIDEWKNQGQLRTTYIPPSVPTTTTQRTIRPTPYSLGAKDFSHPLQVSVDPPKQSPLYGVSSTSSGVLDPGKSKSHSGFTVYTSPHSHSIPSHMRSALRPDPEFPQTPAAIPHLTTSHGSIDRSPLRYRQLSPGTSTTTSPTAFRQQEYPPRSHFSLLSTQGWAFQDTHHRHRQHLEDSRGDGIDRRFRSESLDRGLGHFGSSSLRGTGTKHHSYPAATDLTVPVSQQYALGFMPQLRSPSSLPASTNTTRPKTKAIRSSQVPQSSRYTAAEVDQMVDAVANYPGNIVPCTLCQKFVKRERLRAHIHECHLLTGEKIICPHCGIALKSKGSFRVHIWRHKRGALPTRSTMSDFEGGRHPSPSHASGPASH